jgi:hypothetical protein
MTGVHFGVLKTITNDRKSLAPRRILVGCRFAIHGAVVAAAFTGLIMVLFQEDFGEENLRNSLFAVLLVWIPSWVMHLGLLLVYSRKLFEPKPREMLLAAE